MNFLFISPQFPSTYWQFCDRLRANGATVVGIGDTPKEDVTDEVLASLDEYREVTSLEDYDQVFRQTAYLSWKYGKLDWIESNNEHWLALDARLRQDFNVTTGPHPAGIARLQSKAQMKPLYATGNIPTARQIRLLTFEQARQFVYGYGTFEGKGVGFPVFAKPEYGVGSEGAFRIDDEAALAQMFDGHDWGGPYVLEEFVPARAIVAYDAIVNSEGDVLFENQERFPPSMSDVVKHQEDLAYWCHPSVDERLRALGHAAIKSFGLRRRFVHMEFFELAENRPGLGMAGDYVGLEVNVRPTGGFSPDLMNFAHATDVYRIWADMVCFDSTLAPQNQSAHWGVYAGRRNSHVYAHTKEQILERFDGEVVVHGPIPQALANDMGDTMFMARIDAEGRRDEFVSFVQERG